MLVEWEDESLVLEIASDDATSKYCYHAGGNRLVVPKEQLAAFRRALKNRGYIMPAGK